MQLSDAQRSKLYELLHYALIDIRQLGWANKSEQAAALADAFHDLPKDFMSPDFDIEAFRDQFLRPYQQQYPDATVKDYVATVDKIMMMGDGFSSN